MPSLSDHVRRDAEHAARSAIRVQLSRFTRRMDEEAKAHIKQQLETAARDGGDIDGVALGREAADRAIAAYISTDEPQPAIEAADTAGEA